jgi:hypothetical protein
MTIVAGVGDLVQRTRDSKAHVGYSVAGRSGGRVMPGAVCTMHKETKCAGFLVKPQNQGRWISQFGPQNRRLWFGDLDLKITVTVSCFGPQNQTDDGLWIAPQNQWEEDGAGHAPRSSGLLRREESWARVSMLALKLAEERRRVMHVASSWRSHEDKVEDGRVNATGFIGLFYPNFAIFVVLGPRDILVF